MSESEIDVISDSSEVSLSGGSGVFCTCMYVCAYVYAVREHWALHIRGLWRMYVCMYVCIHVCMHASMYA